MIAMKSRLDPRKAASEAMKAMSDLHAYVRRCGLDHKLIELVKLRASQINSCAWCMDMHTKELRAAGESEQRLYLLSAWRECPLYTERERAALAWTEALTLLAEGNVPDDIFALARSQFSEVSHRSGQLPARRPPCGRMIDRRPPPFIPPPLATRLWGREGWGYSPGVCLRRASGRCPQAARNIERRSG